MKKFVQRKLDEEGCDALELAAAMLKMQVGDKSEEIPVDEFVIRRQGRFGDGVRDGRGRDGRTRGNRDGFGGRRGDRRGNHDGAEHRNGETHGDNRRRSGNADRKRTEGREDSRRRSTEKRRNEENIRSKRDKGDSIGNSFPKRKR